MRHHAGRLDLETRKAPEGWDTVSTRQPTGEMADLEGATAYVVGADATAITAEHWNALRQFWTRYLMTAGARIPHSFTLMRLNTHLAKDDRTTRFLLATRI
jgi:hypothetical protein